MKTCEASLTYTPLRVPVPLMDMMGEMLRSAWKSFHHSVTFVFV